MSEPATDTRELVVMENTPATVVNADPGAAVSAFHNYLEIQKALDLAMPDCIMTVGKGDNARQYRKKQYWRAIATAFNLDLELVEERREDTDGDWGYLVTYRATANNGRSCVGDGSCFASEKYRGQDTVHNVRSHAHTRAKNRAISDLVGFGEVSADEINEHGEPAGHTRPMSHQRRDSGPSPRAPQSGAVASEKQTKMLYAKSMARARVLLDEAVESDLSVPYSDEKEAGNAIRAAAWAHLGGGETVLRQHVDPLVAAIDSATLDGEGRVYIPGGEGDPSPDPFE